MRDARKCNVCGAPRGSDGCTNGRCYRCHVDHCGPGGITGPGHGLGKPPKLVQYDELVAALRKICDAKDGIAVINAVAEARALIKEVA